MKQRFVSGREFAFRRQRIGLLIGHFVRLADHTNEFGARWLLEDSLAMLAELRLAGYHPRDLVKVLQRLSNEYQYLSPLFGSLIAVVELQGVYTDDFAFLKRKQEREGSLLPSLSSSVFGF